MNIFSGLPAVLLLGRIFLETCIQWKIPWLRDMSELWMFPGAIIKRVSLLNLFSCASISANRLHPQHWVMMTLGFSCLPGLSDSMFKLPGCTCVLNRLLIL